MFAILGDSPDGPTGEVRSGIAAGVATLAATPASELREFRWAAYYDYSRDWVFVKVTCSERSELAGGFIKEGEAARSLLADFRAHFFPVLR
jgi:hypothetical protein